MTTPASRVEGEPGRRPARRCDAASPEGASRPAASSASTRAADGGPRQTGDPDQLGTGPRRAVEHELEQLAGTGRAARGRERANRAGHVS